MGELKKWLKQDWVRIGTDGEIKGPCGTSKDKKNPDRCLPRSKANSLSKKSEKKPLKKRNVKEEKAKLSSKTPKPQEVKFAKKGGEIKQTKAKRPFKGKAKKGTAVARGCGAIMANRRKRTKGAVTQS